MVDWVTSEMVSAILQGTQCLSITSGSSPVAITTYAKMVLSVLRSERRRLHLLGATGCLGGPSTNPPASQQEPCSTSSTDDSAKCLHTTPAVHWEKFARVLREPVPKAHVLNRDNYKAWCRSGLDIGMAQQLLGKMDKMSRLRTDGDVSASVKALVESAASLTELQFVVDKVGSFMSPGVVLKACNQAVELWSKASSCSEATVTLHPSHITHQAKVILSSLLQQLPEQLDEQPTSSLTQLMYCLARLHPDGSQHVQDMITQELTSASGYRLSLASSWQVGNALQSAAMLGWSRHQPRAWATLVSAAAERGDINQPGYATHVVHALCTARDLRSPLWSKVSQSLEQNLKPWTQSNPGLVVDMLYTITRHQAPTTITASQVAAIVLSGNTNTNISGSSKHKGGSVGINPLLQGLTPKHLVRLAATLAALNADSKAGVDVGVELALTAVCAESAPLVVRMSLKELSILLGAVAVGLKGKPHAVVSLARDVVAVRGLARPASLGPTLTLIQQLSTVMGSQQSLTQLLSNHAVKLLPYLPPSDIAALVACWAHHAAPIVATRVLIAAASHLGSPKADPSEWNAQTIDAYGSALHATCELLASARDGVGLDTRNDLREAAERLADLLSQTNKEVLEAAFNTREKKAFWKEVKALMTRSAVALGGHALYTTLPAA